MLTDFDLLFILRLIYFLKNALVEYLQMKRTIKCCLNFHLFPTENEFVYIVINYQGLTTYSWFKRIYYTYEEFARQ